MRPAIDFDRSRMVRATCTHIKSILFLDWRDRSKTKRTLCNTGIVQGRFDFEYPPIGNPKGRAHLHRYLRKVFWTYLDMIFQTSLDPVTNSLRQNGLIWVQVALVWCYIGNTEAKSILNRRAANIVINLLQRLQSTQGRMYCNKYFRVAFKMALPFCQMHWAMIA